MSNAITGSVGGDTLNGTGESALLLGQQGDDTLLGSSGNDTQDGWMVNLATGAVTIGGRSGQAQMRGMEAVSMGRASQFA